MGFISNAFGGNVDQNNFQTPVSAQQVDTSGISTDKGIMAQQQAFASALQTQAGGGGPSAASAMLNNQAQQNAAGAMGMAAAQRGINPGLALTQALQAGAQGNQQAAQQAAQARVSEQLGAQGMLGSQLNAMQGAQLTAQGQKLGAQQGNQQAALGASQLNTQISQGNANNNAAVGGGIVGGLGGLLGLGKYNGGMIQHKAMGGPVLPLSIAPASTAGSTALGNAFGSFIPKNKPSQGSGSSTMGEGFGSDSSVLGGGPMDAMGGAGEAAGLGDMGAAAMLASHGGKITGKATVKGDSPKNDTVPTMLSPGEIVIPRSIAHDPEKAKQFVEAEISKRSNKAEHPHVTRMKKAHKALGEAIEAMSCGGMARGYADGGDVEEESPAPDQQLMAPMEMPAQQSAPMGINENTPDQYQSDMPAPPPARPMTAGVEQAATAQPTSMAQQSAVAAGKQPVPMSKELMDIQNKEIGAAQMSAKAQAEGQTQIAKAYADHAEDLKSSQAKYQQNYDALNKEHDTLVSRYQNQQVDPHRVLGSTGSKITAAIALLLGGIGQGLSKSNHNVALDVINKSIDDDIASQKASLGKTANLLTLNMHKFHNLDQAEAVTRMQKMAAVQALVGSYAAKAGSPQALANGQMMAGQIQERMIPLKNDIAYRQTLSQMGTGSGGQMNPEMLRKEDRERAVSVPGPNGQSRLVLAPTPKDAEAFKTAEAEHQNLQSQLQQAASFMKDKGWSPGVGPFDTADSSEAGNIRSGIMLSLNKLHGLNRLNDNEFEEFKRMVPNPGQFNTSAAAAKLDYLNKRLQNSRNSSHKNLLENYNPGSIQESAPKFKRAS